MLSFVMSAYSSAPIEECFVSGFPLRISCSKGLPRRARPKPSGSDRVQCVITQNNETVYNKEISWSDKYIKYSNLTENENLDGTLIQVFTIWNDQVYSQTYVIKMKARCDAVETEQITISAGMQWTIGCSVPKGMPTILTDDEEKILQVSWYKGENIVEPDNNVFKIINGEKYLGAYRTYSAIKILNATFKDTPGIYKCVVKYRNSIVKARSETICVKSTSSDRLVIVTESKKHIIAPGMTKNLTCFGTARSTKSTADAIWTKNGTELCRNDERNCFFVVKEDKVCSPSSESADARRNFVSTFILENATFDDAGVYTCTIHTAAGIRSSNITVVVRTPIKSSGITLAAGIVIGVLILFIIICSIFHWKRIEILYLHKKKFGKFVETNNPITYFIYAGDAYMLNHESNPVSDVRTWLTKRDLAFCDPNEGKEWNDVGAPVAENSLASMEHCLSMTVFLTPALLNENTMELFKTYSGFEDNVKRNFPVVFVCTPQFIRDMKKRAKPTKQKDTDNDSIKDEVPEVYRTCLRFVQRNTVIYWDPKDKGKFFRSLYVALPKVKGRSGISFSEDQSDCNEKDVK